MTTNTNIELNVYKLARRVWYAGIRIPAVSTAPIDCATGRTYVGEYTYIYAYRGKTYVYACTNTYI